MKRGSLVLGVSTASLFAATLAQAQIAWTVTDHLSLTDPSALYRIDLATGALERVGSLGPTVFFYYGGLAYDTPRQTLYAVHFLGQEFLRIDTDTGQATVIGSTAPHYMYSVAYDPVSDKLYSFGWDMNQFGFYEIDRATGAPRRIASGYQRVLVGLTYDASRGEIVGIAREDANLYAIDRATGDLTWLGHTGIFFNHGGLEHVPGRNAFFTVDSSGYLYRIDQQTFARTEIVRHVGYSFDGLALVPEPGTLLALGGGLGLLLARRRRGRASAHR